MTDRELMQQALEALAWCFRNTVYADPDGTIAALRERLAQPEQEPAAYVRDQDNPSYMFTSPPRQERQEPVAKICHDLPGHIGWNPKLPHLPDEGTPLYTAPQPRQWVGLTEEEVVQVLGNVRESVSGNVFLAFARAIEAKLQEKNT